MRSRESFIVDKRDLHKSTLELRSAEICGRGHHDRSTVGHQHMMFQERIPLAPLTSYRIGGEARYFFEARNADDIRNAMGEARKKKLAVFILGGGTNLLVSDKGFPGLVLKPNLSFLERDGEEVRVGAGVMMDGLLRFTADEGLTGLEWAGGLPGTVGGAVRGNAGAFGGEIKDAVATVRSLHLGSGEEIERDGAGCRFSYRSSIFKETDGKEAILSVALTLAKGESGRIRAAIEDKIKYRSERHPMEYPNVGSIFKNVPWEKVPKAHRRACEHVVKTDPFPVIPTAYLISEAGLKGVSRGGAMISPKHPNFIVNVLGATHEDVKNLIDLAKKEVKKKFRIALEEEIIRVS